MILTAVTIRKSLLAGVLACLLIPTASALDMVFLKDGNTFTGQIYKKDEDGSIYLNLSDGTKRYIQNDEIERIYSLTEKIKNEKKSSSISEDNLIRKYSGFKIPELIEKLDSANKRVSDLEIMVKETSEKLKTVTKEVTKHKSSKIDSSATEQYLENISTLESQLSQNEAELEDT
ncbi:MAG: hypothetical protein NC044_08730, partial [Prevotella sp.]|nr:hypothetical protein [Bacteroides sp.]MCM1446474.1 hypothetical protein [Prevotella sp.]